MRPLHEPGLDMGEGAGEGEGGETKLEAGGAAGFIGLRNDAELQDDGLEGNFEHDQCAELPQRL